MDDKIKGLVSGGIVATSGLRTIGVDCEERVIPLSSVLQAKSQMIEVEFIVGDDKTVDALLMEAQLSKAHASALSDERKGTL
ncbi:hypothetical protein J2TS6_48950 [Paenibacillus albilobatus]|uniref:Uncharacterized protein n=1 Tax=Paenibacillus albilobatus TaxID=2716884 RepID=A0A919XJA9_9BACL|nr:hypothetical protein [Paenibacillus albilobatus]GIO33754.1 hypothetical protein J2TS6_48950 [Paenibacillus albilobatus]